MELAEEHGKNVVKTPLYLLKILELFVKFNTLTWTP